MASAPAELILSLDELAALNDEIAALARCGISLDGGLAALARDLPGRLGMAASELSTRLAAGESLPAILARHKGAFPRLYAAVVEAGRRAGHLPLALESLSVTARRVAELRRLAGHAILYPLVVVGVAYTLLVLVVGQYLTNLNREYREFNLNPSGMLVALDWFCAAMRSYWYLPPLVAVVVLAGIWIAWGRAWAVDAGWAQRLLTLVPGTGRVLRLSRRAAFSEVLALLVDQHVPLADAVTLAADATGDAALRRAAAQYSARLRAGERLAPREAAALGLPQLVGWLLAGEHREAELAACLRQMAAADRSRAERIVDRLNLYAPVVLSLVLGGITTVVYALAVFWPWAQLLQHIANY